MAQTPLDLSLFTEGDSSQRQQFASELLKTLDQHGFVKIVGHGVPKSELEEFFAWVSNADNYLHRQ